MVAKMRRFAWLPVIAAVVWFGIILALLIVWTASGAPRYRRDNPTINYISDVGAVKKGIFIPGAIVTSIFFVLSLIADRMLRHREYTSTFLRRRESVFSMLAIIAGFIAGLALSLLSIFDTDNHHNAHWTFTVIFIVGVFINAVFFSLEINSLYRGYPNIRALRRSRNSKLVIASIGIVLAIVMAILMGSCSDDCSGDNGNQCDNKCDTTESVAAVFEWIIAFLFSIYLLTFVYDLIIDEENVVIDQAHAQQGQQMEEGVAKPPTVGDVAPTTAPTGGSAQ